MLHHFTSILTKPALLCFPPLRPPVLQSILTNITNTAYAAASNPASAADDATSLTSIVTESTHPVTLADAYLESPKKKKATDQPKLTNKRSGQKKHGGGI